MSHHKFFFSLVDLAFKRHVRTIPRLIFNLYMWPYAKGLKTRSCDLFILDQTFERYSRQAENSFPVTVHKMKCLIYCLLTGLNNINRVVLLIHVVNMFSLHVNNTKLNSFSKVCAKFPTLRSYIFFRDYEKEAFVQLKFEKVMMI